MARSYCYCNNVTLPKVIRADNRYPDVMTLLSVVCRPGVPGPCQPELHLLYLSLLYLDINIAVILKVTESEDYNGGFQGGATDTHPTPRPPPPPPTVQFISFSCNFFLWQFSQIIIWRCTIPSGVDASIHAKPWIRHLIYGGNQNRIQTKAKIITTRNKETKFIINISYERTNENITTKDERGNIT